MSSYDSQSPAARYTVPARIAELGFGIDLPAGWTVHDLPDDSADFDNPLHTIALMVATAPHAAIVWAVAARPAYGDGTLSDWGRYLLEHAGLVPRAQGEGRLGALPALVGEAVLQSEVGPMLVRYAFAEDGGRLLNATLSAPLMLADAVHHVWTHALASFVLETPRGPTVPVWPAVEAAPPAAEVEDTDGVPTAPLAVETLPEETEAGDGAPAWWQAARRLEQADRLEEAERAITRAVDHLGACISVAELYLQRCQRLAALGDMAGMAQARAAAERWARAYAAGATSGGEGAALSRERDAFLARLGHCGA